MKDTEVIKKSDQIVSKLVDMLSVECEKKIAMEVDDDEEKYLKISIEGDDVGSLIGYRGKTLNAIQLIVSQMIARDLEDRIRVLVDVNNYRERRKEYLQSLGRKAAAQAQENNQSVELPPLSPYERRIIHMSLKDVDGVETESEGEGRDRHIVVKVKK